MSWICDPCGDTGVVRDISYRTYKLCECQNDTGETIELPMELTHDRNPLQELRRVLAGIKYTESRMSHQEKARKWLAKLSPRERRELWAEFAKLDGRDT